MLAQFAPSSSVQNSSGSVKGVSDYFCSSVSPLAKTEFAVNGKLFSVYCLMNGFGKYWLCTVQYIGLTKVLGCSQDLLFLQLTPIFLLLLAAFY